MKHNVMIIQSRTTGRFLLRQENNSWGFPSNMPNDYEKPIVYLAMDDCGTALGQDVQDNEWVLDYIEDPVHQIFHVWVSDEPMGQGSYAWHSLFDFPEATDSMVAYMVNNQQFLERSLCPQC